MPASNVRLGGAYFTSTVDARGYEAGANRAIAANRRLGGSYGRLNQQLTVPQTVASNTTAALRRTVLATGGLFAAARRCNQRSGS